MKKILFVAFLLTLFHTAYATDYVRLHGFIKNSRFDSLIVFTKAADPVVDFRTYAVKLDKKTGAFNKKIHINQKFQRFSIMIGSCITDLVASPGDDLYITANASKFDSTLHYSGRGSNVANFIAKHKLVQGPMYKFETRLKTKLPESAAAFEKDNQVLLSNEMDFLNKN